MKQTILFIKSLVLIVILSSTLTEVLAQVSYEIDDFETEQMGFTNYLEYASYNAAASGDINGDGLEDLIFASGPSMFVVFGDADREDTELRTSSFGSDFDGTIGFRIRGFTSQQAEDGVALATGDFNDDGFDDIVIGLAGGGSLDTGSITIIHGTDEPFEAELNVTEMSNEQGFTVEGANNSNRLGMDVDVADVNGDEIDDLLFLNNGGELLIGVYGSTEGIQSTDISENLEFSADYETIFRIEADYPSISTNREIATGDFNGDGLVDFAMTDPANSSDRGMVVLIYGMDEFPAEDVDVFSLEEGQVKFINARGNEEAMGFAIETADMNNDGMDDLIVGAPFSDINDDGASGDANGLIYIFPGMEVDSVLQVDTDTLSSISGITTITISDEDFQTHEIGRTLAIGDVNNDGVADLLIGSGSDDGRRTGNTYLIFGAQDNLEAEITLLELMEEQGFTIYGERDQFENASGIGGRLVYMADLNGDDSADMIVGGNIFGEREYLYVIDNLDGVPVSNEREIKRVTDFRLKQNYPNPFNPSTNISYALPEAAEIRLSVYDLLGREVATIVNSRKQAGNHTARFDAGNLSSGIYIYRISAGSFSQTRRMMLIK